MKPFLCFTLSVLIHLPLFLTSSLNENEARVFSLKKGDGSIKIVLKVREQKKRTSQPKKLSQKSSLLKKDKQAKKEIVSDKKEDSSSGESSEIAKYLSLVREQINENLYISRIAQKMNLTGSVEVHFNIHAPNIIKELEISRSSNFKALDRSALQTVKSIESVPSIPKALKLSIISVDATVIYE